MAKQNLQRKKDFEKWLKQSVVPAIPEVSDSTVKKALASVGVKNVALFDESEELKVRLYVSELIMKREKSKLDNPNDYLAVVNRLLCYAEFLGCKGKVIKPEKTEKASPEKTEKASPEKKSAVSVNKSETSVPEGRDKLEDTLIVSYYLSRINVVAVKELGYGSFRAAFDGLAKLMGQKPATIKNMRDEFDPYFDNGRAGWYQRTMSPSRKAVFDKMAPVSDENLTAIVKEIVMAYTPVIQGDSEKPSKHKKIKIASDDMKEIRTKKK